MSEPTPLRKIVSALVALALAEAVLWFVEWRSAPPSPPQVEIPGKLRRTPPSEPQPNSPVSLLTKDVGNA
ncbi:hypothetical protein CfE428DRAFT_6688 [Chthoniobacter flavus Ellin428]|uniref:Uncharacterized protein n=1 Tax=Chthoniobacter flavus Ellin428 TaxID=497964 RepID=B4DCP7_9BACT|nr:hypothetical protein CfE428DRAFT_6688 [Chthoniobacter flavus Ellin428]